MTVADPPEEFSGTVEPPKGWAAGATAVAVSLRRGVGQMGTRRTLSTLRALNQPDGFDCPGLRLARAGTRAHRASSARTV